MPNEVQIDKLLLEIEVKQDGVSKKLNQISKSVDKLQTAFASFDEQSISNKLNNISKVFSAISLTGAGNASKDFNKLSKALKNITNVDFDAKNLYQKFQRLTRIVRPFVEEVQKAESALVAMNNVMQSTSNAKGTSGNIASSDKKSSKNGLFNVSNMYHIVRVLQIVARGVQKVGSAMKDLLQYGMDYTETLNLWQVAMGANIDQADDFVNRMADAYGYATKTIMQYQATFRNMLSSLGGVDSNVSYQLSEYLMQMAGDFASLYNLSIEKAMQTFQSVLAGQVRPVRSISGYDITENTIYELYQSLGGEKTMRQLSATEKRLLRIYAVFQQMERSGAVGDLAKTLQNSANQVRIINEELTELKTWLGNILEMYMRPLLPIVNAFLIVATEIAKTLATELGYEAFDGTIAGLEEASEQADELSGKLLSFDKFEALNSNEGENTMGIDSVLLESMSKYEGIMENVNTLAQQIAEQWLPLFIDKEGNLINGGEKLKNIFEKLFGGFKDLYEVDENGVFVGWTEKAEKIWKIFERIFNIISELITVFEPLGNLGLELGVDLLESIVDLVESLLPALKFIVAIVGGLAVVLSAILQTINKIIQSIAWLFKIKDWGKGNLGAIWSDWGITANYASQWANAENTKWAGEIAEDLVLNSNQYNTTPRMRANVNRLNSTPNITSANNGITQGVYNGMMAVNSQADSRGVGNVYLDGKLVGIYTAEASHKENIRTGRVKVNR